MSVYPFDIAQGGVFANVRRIAALAGPILVGQLAFIAFGAIDTAMVGRYSAIDLAALSLGAAINISVFMGLATILFSLQPIVGRLFGARDYRQIGVQMREAAWLALVLAMAGAVALYYPTLILRIAAASDAVNAKAVAYLRILSFAFPASIGFWLFGSLANVVSRQRQTTFIWLSALIVKVPLTAWFIYGGFGVRALGGPGAALATAIVIWLAALAAAALARWHPFYRQFGIFEHLSWPRWRYQREFLRLGIPMALSSLIEVTSYTFMTLFIARFGAIVLAGHQIAVNLGAVLYMMPLAIGIATSTLVSRELGAGAPTGARSVSRTGIGLAALCATLLATIVMAARHAIVGIYTSSPEVAAVAMSLVQIVAFYHLADAVQVSTAYALRGYKVTVIPTVIYAGALYGIGLCGGYVVAFNVLHVVPAVLAGARGFWWANTVSLALAGGCLLFYWDRVSRVAMDGRQQRAVR